MFVVDASITLAWCFADESSDTTDGVLRRLLTEGGVAPGHWPMEVSNGLRFGERRGRIDEARWSVARSLLTDLPVDIVQVDVAAALDVVDLARRHDLTVYDAVYMDLAASRGLALATADRRLAAACRAAGVALIAA